MENIFKLAENAVNELVKNGSSSASASCYKGELNELNVDADEFSLLRTTFDSTLSLSCIKQNRKGSVSGNDLSEEGVKALVDECLLSSDSAPEDSAWEMCSTPNKKEYSFGAPCNKDKMFERAEEFLFDVKKEYPLVTLEQMIISHCQSSNIYLNNHGVRYDTSCGFYHIMITVLGREGEKSSSMSYCSRRLYDLDKPIIEISGLRQLISSAEKQIHTVPFVGKGEYPVILAPDTAGEFVYYALSNFASGGSLLSGTAIWKDKLGKDVVDKRINISIDPFHPSIVSPTLYTSEGYEAKGYDIIKDGMLNSFIIDRYHANKLGMEASPTDGSEAIIAPGDTSLVDLISGIDKGILVERFSGGMPAIDGEFSGVAKNAFLIEKGKITSALSETMISGNLEKLFNSIIGISKETIEDGGSSKPYMAVDGITVSGV